MSTDNPYKTEHHCIGLIGIPPQSIGGCIQYCTFAVQFGWHVNNTPKLQHLLKI